MKYAIFGCLLFILGISAIQHESPAQKTNKLNPYLSAYLDFDLKWVNEQLVIDEVRNHKLPVKTGDLVIQIDKADGMQEGEMIAHNRFYDPKGQQAIKLDKFDLNQSKTQIYVSRKNAPEEILILQLNSEGGWDDVTSRDKEIPSYVDSGDR